VTFLDMSKISWNKSHSRHAIVTPIAACVTPSSNDPFGGIADAQITLRGKRTHAVLHFHVVSHNTYVLGLDLRFPQNVGQILECKQDEVRWPLLFHLDVFPTLATAGETEKMRILRRTDEWLGKEATSESAVKVSVSLLQLATYWNPKAAQIWCNTRPAGGESDKDVIGKVKEVSELYNKIDWEESLTA
jgi:hypothetical protein